MLAALYNVPSSPEALQVFSFNNADEHTQIVREVMRQLGVTLQTFVLDPIPTSDFQTWLEIHQNVHTEQNSVLGISGNDLSDVDPSNHAQLEAWIYLHAIEHRQASLKLGIG